MAISVSNAAKSSLQHLVSNTSRQPSHNRQQQRPRLKARPKHRMSTWRSSRGGRAATTALELCIRSTSMQTRSFSRHTLQSRHPLLTAQHTLTGLQSFSQCKREVIRNHILDLTQKRRRFSAQTRLSHGHIDPPKPGEELYVTFVDKDGDEHQFAVSKGDNLLDIAQANDIEMEGEEVSSYAIE